MIKKTKIELEKEITGIGAKLVSLEMQSNNLIRENKALLGDRDSLQRIIFNIGNIVFGPNWIQKRSYSNLVDEIRICFIDVETNIGKYHGMKEAYSMLLDKLVIHTKDKNKV